jgi:hypothetical protein
MANCNWALRILVGFYLGNESWSCHNDDGLTTVRVNCMVSNLTALGSKGAEMRTTGRPLKGDVKGNNFPMTGGQQNFCLGIQPL